MSLLRLTTRACVEMFVKASLDARGIEGAKLARSLVAAGELIIDVVPRGPACARHSAADDRFADTCDEPPLARPSCSTTGATTTPRRQAQ